MAGNPLDKMWVHYPSDIAEDTHPVARLEDLDPELRAAAEATLAKLKAERVRQGIDQPNPLGKKSGLPGG